MAYFDSESSFPSLPLQEAIQNYLLNSFSGNQSAPDFTATQGLVEDLFNELLEKVVFENNSDLE